MNSFSPTVDSLRMLTSTLDLICQAISKEKHPPPLTADQVSDVKSFFLKAIVDWLCILRDLSIRGHGAKNLHQKFVNKANLCAAKAIESLRKLVDGLNDPSGRASATQSNVVKQLGVLKRVNTSERPSVWTEYCEKLKTACTILCNRLLTSRAMDSEDAVRDAVEKDEVRKFVEQTLKRIRLGSPQKNAYSNLGSGDVALFRDLNLIISEMSTLHTIWMSADTPAFEDCFTITFDTRDHSSPRKGSRSNWSASERANAEELVPGENSDEITDVPETPEFDKGTVDQSQDCVSLIDGLEKSRKVRKLVNSSEFDGFLGPPLTPLPSPTGKVGRVVWEISVSPGRKRVPWTIEESIALWHGVHNGPGRGNWSQIWRQSFVRSSRGPVDLKDRWRIIEKSQTLHETVKKAYDSWIEKTKSDDKENQTCIPVIVHRRDGK
ncbi:unnamed protein product [Calicophoron daubneyi]